LNQFDYLSRLGDRIEDLDSDLFRNEGGSVTAIGIVGGDTYDTLMILQALRPKLPNALFFTTGLDSRFWDSSELKWSRNLIVASGYGLQLNRELQGQVPPFRNSVQTAQFAAVLAALKVPGLIEGMEIPPRRFEIGRTGPVDLSVVEGRFLHPSPAWETGTSIPDRLIYSLAWAALAITVMGTLVLRPWRRMTVDRRSYVKGALWFREEDIGGLSGFRMIMDRFDRRTDDVSVGKLAESWRHYQKENVPNEVGEPKLGGEGFLESLIGDIYPDEILRREETAERMQDFLDFLNEEMKGVFWRNRVLETGSDFPNEHLPTIGSELVLKNSRQELNRVIDLLLGSPKAASEGLNFSVEQAARDSRNVGLTVFEERRSKLWGFWIGVPLVLILGLGLVVAVRWDAYSIPGGEPFSLISGTSAWPGIGLRMLAIILSIVFIMRSYSLLREAMEELTRRYRMPWTVTVRPGGFRGALCLLLRLGKSPFGSWGRLFKKMALSTSATQASCMRLMNGGNTR
jgi:hypothetical protein